MFHATPLPHMNLSPCQEKALKLLEENPSNIFLTGHAGSGKSFLIEHFLKNKDPKTFPIVASTGAAAVIVGGRTFHSFFGLGIMEGGLEKTVERAAANKRVGQRLRKLEGFILDEVSMISGTTLRAAETICRMARKNSLPWGGVRVIAVGDFAQLPPVSRSNETKDWAFLDETWANTRFLPIALNTIVRSQDDDYAFILNQIRNGQINDDVKSYLNSKVDPNLSDENALQTTHLFPHREKADVFNQLRLVEIEQPLHEFPTTYLGDERTIEQLKKQAPIPDVLRLKVSALVMIRINDPMQRFVNGSLGTIIEIEKDKLHIKLKNKKVVSLESTSFALQDADGHIKASASNFPVTLAYATTIHKAQGATLDSMVCDLRRLWEPGQAYVALSRLRSGNGLKLVGWDESSIRIDSEVIAFHKTLSNKRLHDSF